MKMIPRFIPVIAVLCAATAMAVWLWSDRDQVSKDPGEKSPLVLKDSISEQVVPAEIREESPDKPGSTDIDGTHNATTVEDEHAIELATEFMNASSATNAEAAILEAEAYDLASAPDWRMELDVACNQAELDYLADQSNSVQRHYAEKLSSYCEGYIPEKDFAQPTDLEMLDQSFLDLARTRSRDRFSRELSDIEPSETDDFLVRRLKSAATPEEIHAIADYIAEYHRHTGLTLWHPDTGDAKVHDAMVASLQRVALELYACQKFGGCGPNSLKVIRTCAFVVGCQPGWSYEQYVFANHSPIQIGYIQGVIRHIYSN